ncbi:Response regulator containing a CheY-like receiver domain and an HD-GYP domain [Rhodospirillaceae bacterium LM-1]|nr:Response regulator containing a CheY-like receiver domain and an HD-GYP domain [Rhodospirillaceae bacterium LM-1]
MPDRVLLIDDDLNLLSGLTRHLHRDFDVVTASGGRQALAAVEDSLTTNQPFAVALCDMRMPGMDGIDTLKAIRGVSPETVRMMLTGNADQQTAIDAINEGSIFRFYTKPCPSELLSDGLKAGCAQYHLVTAEHELLEKTLAGSVKVLVDVVSLNDPIAYAQASRLRELVRLMLHSLEMPHRWQLDIAAMLLFIGQVAIPPELITKMRDGKPLSDLEKSVVARAPEAGRNLIANIPRLGGVAEIVYLQDRGFDGSGLPADGPVGRDIPFDARLLKILKDLVDTARGKSLTRDIFNAIERHAAQYDPDLLHKVRLHLEEVVSDVPPREIEISVSALKPGLMVTTDIRLENGHLILAAGTRLSEVQVERLRSLRQIFPIVDRVKVRV